MLKRREGVKREVSLASSCKKNGGQEAPCSECEGRKEILRTRVVVAVEEGVGQRDGFDAAHGGFHGPADCAAGEAEHRCAIPPIVWTGDDEVDRAARGEVVVETDLDAGGWCAVYEYPFVFLRGGGGG